MRNQVETQKEWSQGTSIHENSMQYLLRGRSENNELQKICSKPNSITFYRSLGMRNQVETQKERSQGTSIHENFMQYLPRGGLWEQWVAKTLLHIQLYLVLLVPWDAQSSGNTKGTVPRDFISWEFYAIFAEGGSVNNELQKICSKSSSFSFYRSPAMRNSI